MLTSRLASIRHAGHTEFIYYSQPCNPSTPDCWFEPETGGRCRISAAVVPEDDQGPASCWSLHIPRSVRTVSSRLSRGVTGAILLLFAMASIAMQNTVASASTTASHPAPFVPAVRVSGNQLINAQGQAVRLIGVDASGTEDACEEDAGFDWGPMDSAEAAEIASWDANAVRVPLNEDCWLGINGVPAQYSGAAYQAAIEQWVTDLNQAGIVAILDLHYAAPGTYEANQQWPMADADHSITFWSQVASAFATDPSVVFDLFNEPFIGNSHPTAADWECWLNGCSYTVPVALTSGGTTTNVTYNTAGMQQMVDAVRSAGATQPIMVGGLNWAGDPCGIDDAGGNGGACAWLTYEPTDPLNQLVASFHTYNWTICTTVTCWDQSVAPLAAQVPVVTGEFGEDDCATTFITQFMDWADQEGISYLAWSWQASYAGNTTCTASSSNTVNLDLLSNWTTNDPSTIAPQGAAIRGHFLAEHENGFAAITSGNIPPLLRGSVGQAANPPAATAEAPQVLLFAASGIGILGAGAVISRRRQRRLLAQAPRPLP
jgi:hypothetical protein